MVKNGELQGPCSFVNSKYFPQTQATESSYNTGATITKYNGYTRFSKTAQYAYATDCVQYRLFINGYTGIYPGDIIHIKAKFTPYPTGTYSVQVSYFGWLINSSSNLSPKNTWTVTSDPEDKYFTVNPNYIDSERIWLIDFVTAGPSGSTFSFDIYDVYIERGSAVLYPSVTFTQNTPIYTFTGRKTLEATSCTANNNYNGLRLYDETTGDLVLSFVTGTYPVSTILNPNHTYSLRPNKTGTNDYSTKFTNLKID